MTSQKRGLINSKQPQPDFCRTCSFSNVLDNVELSLDIKFQQILMVGYKDMVKNLHDLKMLAFQIRNT